MKKNLLLALLLLALAAPTWGVRPLSRVQTWRQSDGTTINVRLCGDGTLGYFLTSDGHVLLPNARRDLCYAVQGANGLEASSVVAHESASRTAAEVSFVSTSSLTPEALTAEIRARKARAGIATSTNPYTPYGEAAAGTVQNLGAPRIPVIMVGFPDLPFQASTTREKVSRFFNEAGYSDEEYCRGSVRDYFTAQSGGLFTPTFEVVDSMEAAFGYALYGGNSPSQDYACRYLVQECLDTAVARGVDFTPYVAGGSVPCVIIYYAGFGEHDTFGTGATDYLWPHFSAPSTSFTAGSLTVKSYFIGNELVNDYSVEQNNGIYTYTVTGQRLEGMGICVHEFGHALGLPDFYNTAGRVTDENGDTIKNLDYWSIMDYGQYAYNGYRPIGYNAYERAMLGWQRIVDLTEADTTDTYVLAPTTAEGDETPTCYRIANPTNSNEFLLLENRQAATWYPAMFGTGMLVLHVDYNASAWRSNTLNNTTAHPRFTHVPADGHKEGTSLTTGTLLGYRNDLFGNGGGRYDITTFYNHNATYSRWAQWFTGDGEVNLYNICQADGLVSFTLSENTTGIHAATPKQGPDETRYYTPDGRRATDPTKPGIYIRQTPSGTQKVLVR